MNADNKLSMKIVVTRKGNIKIGYEINSGLLDTPCMIIILYIRNVIDFENIKIDFTSPLITPENLEEITSLLISECASVDIINAVRDRINVLIAKQCEFRPQYEKLGGRIITHIAHIFHIFQ